MPNTFLTVPFKDKESAKALGARWDGLHKQWFVPDGRDLAPFATWLPAGSVQAAAISKVGTEITIIQKGISLSQLLAGVSLAVAQAYRAGVWTLVEVVELRANAGHVYMGVCERDAHGDVRAKSNAVIWQSKANVILPAFARATGAQLAPGIKLLVRARPVFKAQHGFSLEIDAIDSEYTLGDLEARKREIRERLKAEGVFDANKQLAPPWDFNAVLVVAPEGGAGLGDFEAEACRLEAVGLCRFTYMLSRFQGEGAAREICEGLQVTLTNWPNSGQPDAVVIIRGGGAVNDLAWLNDYDLARVLCDCPVPVLTGIGHERDSTLLDEVAHTKYDTPSKVVAGIEQRIARRATEARANFEQIASLAANIAQSVRARAGLLDQSVRADALRHLAQGKQATAALVAEMRLDAMQAIRLASEQSREALQSVKTGAMVQVAAAKRDVPLLWGEITLGAKHATQSASTQNAALMGSVLERAQLDAARAKQKAQEAMAGVGTAARQLVRDGASRSQALMREIAGQGPEKTLSRGFALVHGQDGKPLTRANHVAAGAAIEIEFQDGRVSAITGQQQL